jgi:hypothetical protein
MPKAQRIEFAEGASGSSPTEDTTMHDAPMQEMLMEPRRPEMPVQDAFRDSVSLETGVNQGECKKHWYYLFHDKKM